jgi:cell division protein FtsI/penicillin-binding protein 2
MMLGYGDKLMQRRRLRIAAFLLLAVGGVLVVRLGYLQLVRHNYYLSKASSEHTSKYEIPASRGELYIHDGADGQAPIALNQTLNELTADPRYVTDKPDVARKLAALTGGNAAEYQSRLEKGIEYAKLADRVPNDVAAKIKALALKGIWLTPKDYRTYPEGSLAAELLGFVNADGVGQYGLEGYLNDKLDGTPGQLAAKTDTNGVPIAVVDNVIKQPVGGQSYLLTIDRNIQAKVEQVLADQIKASKAKSGAVLVLDPATGAVRAMATYPTYDPNQYSAVKDYGVFMNQTTDEQFEPGSGMKAFTMAAGLNEGKITPDSKYDDPGCVMVDGRNICNAAGDKAGPGKTMTMVLRDSLNTGVMYVLRLLGGDANKITLTGKQMLFNYFTKHFGFGQRTGIEQAGEVAGTVNAASNNSGNDVNYANMTFGQGVSVTMVQMAAAMAAVANGGRLYQPHLVDAEMNADGSTRPIMPKLVRDGVLTKTAISELTQMLTVVVMHGSGYLAQIKGYENQIAGKTGTAQIPKPDGTGYIDGANIGTFTGFAPVSSPRFVLMVRINEPEINGYAEVTTVPAFREICNWLFQYYGIPPNQ